MLPSRDIHLIQCMLVCKVGKGGLFKDPGNQTAAYRSFQEMCAVIKNMCMYQSLKVASVPPHHYTCTSCTILLNAILDCN